MNGAELIAQERQRQIEEEGWTPEHDDEHTESELARAAICYTIAGLHPSESPDGIYATEHFATVWWPARWAASWWKPAGRVKNLIKAGALIAAEIDRLQRILSHGTA